jgi:hypothetical protein
VVEFAVAILLLVPVAIYAIYAGELFAVGMKAQEAEMLGAWNVTGHVLHDLENGSQLARNDRFATATSLEAARSRTQLADLDSFQNGVRPLQHLVRGQVEAVDCRRNDGLPPEARFRSIPRQPPPVPAGFRSYQEHGSRPWANDFLVPTGFVRCTARARAVSAVGEIRHHEEFSRTGYTLLEAFSNITMCGSGPTLNGCGARGGIVVLMDDWAVDDGRSSPVTASNGPWPVGQGYADPPTAPANARLFNPGNAVFRAHGRGLGRQQVLLPQPEPGLPERLERRGDRGRGDVCPHLPGPQRSAQQLPGAPPFDLQGLAVVKPRAAPRLRWAILPVLFGGAFWLGFREREADPSGWGDSVVLAPDFARHAAPPSRGPAPTEAVTPAPAESRVSQDRLRQLLPPFPGAPAWTPLGETMDAQGQWEVALLEDRGVTSVTGHRRAGGPR